MEYVFAVVLFAVSASVTPGPNNIMVMTSGLNFGVKRSLPLLLGICIGFTFMLLLVGFGIAQLFDLFPSLHFFIKCVGTLYLLYLAWLIANTSDNANIDSRSIPLSFMKGVLFQWLNAKAWVVSTGAIATFTTVGPSFYSQNLTIALVFFIVSFPCVGIWLLFGSTLKRILKSDQNRRLFSYSMSGVLVLSVVPAVDEIVGQLVQAAI